MVTVSLTYANFITMGKTIVYASCGGIKSACCMQIQNPQLWHCNVP